MSAKHTPGPWDSCGLNKRWGIYPASAVNDGIDYFVAATRQLSNPETEKANARLMAAAPEQNEALKWALDEIDALSNRLVQFAYPQGMAMLGRENQAPHYLAARAALSKAEGK